MAAKKTKKGPTIRRPGRPRKNEAERVEKPTNTGKEGTKRKHSPTGGENESKKSRSDKGDSPAHQKSESLAPPPTPKSWLAEYKRRKALALARTEPNMVPDIVDKGAGLELSRDEVGNVEHATVVSAIGTPAKARKGTSSTLTRILRSFN